MPNWPLDGPLEKLSFRRVDAEILQNARRKDRASFFEDERLKEFLHLEWDIKIKESLVKEFIHKYNSNNRTVSMSAGKLSIDDELLAEVFHLPTGDYKIRKKNNMTRKIDSSFFGLNLRNDTGLSLVGCTDKIWGDRFKFLHDTVMGMSMRYEVSYCFIEFLQAEGEKRDWLDAFRWFFELEIDRIRNKATKTSYDECTGIGKHISLILAHMGNKKDPPLPVGLELQSLTIGPSSPKKTDDEELNGASEEESESKGDDFYSADGDFFVVEEEILEHFDERHQGIKKMEATVSKLQKEARIWRDEYVTSSQLSHVVQRQNTVLQKEVEKWKRECAKAQQAREELEEKLTAFSTSTNLGTTATPSNDITPVLEDSLTPVPEYYSPLSGSDSPPSKKTKASTDRRGIEFKIPADFLIQGFEM